MVAIRSCRLGLMASFFEKETPTAGHKKKLLASVRPIGSRQSQRASRWPGYSHRAHARQIDGPPCS
jgi:hypothetical protein